MSLTLTVSVAAAQGAKHVCTLLTWVDALEQAVQRRLAALADQVREQLQGLPVYAQAAVLAGAVHRPAQRGSHVLAGGGPLCLHRL